jgi:D-glycero-alpha-D-manno-heptose 1-phosphate guanylyltransferase
MSGIENLIILCGGKGTRLKSVAGQIAKPLVPIYKDKCILDYIIYNIKNWGIKNVYISACYKAETFNEWLVVRKFPFNIEIIVEEIPLGTGGAVKYVTDVASINEPFAVLNGDTFVPLCFSKMAFEYFQNPCGAMIGLSEVDNCGRYGKVLESESVVTNFLEKSSDSTSGWINNGCYILEKQIFEDTKSVFSMETDLFSLLVNKRILKCYKDSGMFIDIGIPDDFFKFSNEIAPNLI